MRAHLDIYVPRAFHWYEELLKPLNFDPWNLPLKIRESIGTPTPKVELPWGVKVHSLTPFHTPRSMLCDSQLPFWPATIANPCLGRKPKARVVTKGNKQKGLFHQVIFYKKNGQHYKRQSRPQEKLNPPREGVRRELNQVHEQNKWLWLQKELELGATWLCMQTKKMINTKKMWSKPHKNLTYMMGDTWLGTWTKYINKIKKEIQTKGTTWFGMWTKETIKTTKKQWRPQEEFEQRGVVWSYMQLEKMIKPIKGIWLRGGRNYLIRYIIRDHN